MTRKPPDRTASFHPSAAGVEGHGRIAHRQQPDAAFDRQMMELALRMADRGLGTTAPNPSVGAVVADETTQTVIARGTTAPGGRPHAEPVALDKAGEAARDQTLYVTLEPCSHHGRSPPCVDAILKAGISRVVVGIEDPDPRVSGRGIDRLRAAGVLVDRAGPAGEAHWLTRGHIVRTTERRPFVQVKMALDKDGEIARGADGAPVWVTGELARRHGHLLRARTDAIVVGGRTVIDDDPDLTCRLPGLGRRSPLRVIIAGSEPLPATARLLTAQGDTPPTLVFCHAASEGPVCIAADEGQETGPGVDLCPVPAIGGQLRLSVVAEELVARGMTRLLIEGGPRLWQAFAHARMIDEVVLFQNLAGRSLESVAESASAVVGRRLAGLNFDRALAHRLDGDAMVVLRRSSGRSP